MKLQDQVCTLEQAKRLKELGVIAKSLFYHEHLFHVSWRISQGPDGSFPIYSAFTASELSVMIDWNYVSVAAPYEEDIDWSMFTKSVVTSPSLVDAMTKVLIHLLENNIITAEEVNKRLAA